MFLNDQDEVEIVSPNEPAPIQSEHTKKSQFPTSILHARIALLATAIGGPEYSIEHTTDSNVHAQVPVHYKHGDDCLACLKDLKKWFKLVDDNQRKYEVAVACANYKILVEDLIPIMLDYETRCKNKKKRERRKKKIGELEPMSLFPVSSPYFDKIALQSLQLMVLMTWPVILNNDSSANQILHYNTLKKHQLLYKKKILESNVLKPVLRIAVAKISTNKQERSPKDHQVLKLVLQFLRNVLAIEPFQMVLTTKKLAQLRTKTKSFHQSSPLPNNVTLEDISLSTTLRNFKTCKVFPVLLTLANSLNTEFDPDFLNQTLAEIFFYLIKSVPPNALLTPMSHENGTPNGTPNGISNATSNGTSNGISNGTSNGISTGNPSTTTNTHHANSDLTSLLSKEKQLRKNVVRNTSSRHSRFGSLISIQTPDNGRLTVSGGTAKDLIDKNTILNKLDDRKKWNKSIVFKDTETVDGLQSNFLQFTKTNNSSNSLNTDVARFLQQFLQDFLDSNSFNILLKSCTDYLISEDFLSEITQIQYLIFYTWFIKYQTCRILDSSANSPKDKEARIGTIEYVMQDTSIVFTTKLLKEAMENKQWAVVHANIVAYTELLTFLNNLDDFYPQDCKYMKEKLFSDDRINLLTMLPRLANKHSVSFVRSTIDLTHMVLKTLEKDSELEIKSHKLKSQKTGSAKMHGNLKVKLEEIKKTENITDDDEAMEVLEDQMMSKKIDFENIMQKYFHNDTVKTYISFLKKYRDLEYHDMKRTLQFFQRLFVEHKEESYLFRLDFIVLLKEMLSPDGLPRNDKIRKHLTTFTNYYLHKLKERLKKSPAWYVDLLFPNLTDKAVGFYSKYGQVNTNFLQNYLCCLPSEFKKLPEEEALPPTVVLDMKFGILVSTLIDDNKYDILTDLLAHLKHSLETLSQDQSKNIDLPHNDNSTDSEMHRLCRGDADFRALLLLLGYTVPVKIADLCYLPKATECSKIRAGISMVSKYMNTSFDTPNGTSSSSYLIRYADDGMVTKKSASKARHEQTSENYHSNDENDYDNDGFVLNDGADEQSEHDEDYFKELSNKKMVNDFLSKGKAAKKKHHSKKKRSGNSLPLHDLDSDDDKEANRKSKKSSKSHIVSASMIDDSDDEYNGEKNMFDSVFFENEQYMRWLLDKHMGSISEEKMKLFGDFTKSRFANKGAITGDWTSLFDGPVPSVVDLELEENHKQDTLENELVRGLSYDEGEDEDGEHIVSPSSPSQATGKPFDLQQEIQFSDDDYDGEPNSLLAKKRSPAEDSDDSFIVRKRGKPNGLFLDEED